MLHISILIVFRNSCYLGSGNLRVENFDWEVLSGKISKDLGGVRGHAPPEKFLIYGALNRDFLHSDTSFLVFSEFYNIL